MILLLLFDKVYPWGALVGVRPTKLIRRYLIMGYTYDEIDEILEKLYFVFPEKRKLLIEVVKKENEYLNPKGVNMYVGIPYCPTRCKYCSFASYEINSKLGNYYDDFVKTLIEEIRLTGEMLKDKDVKIESLYFGGGTPSILKEKDLKNILEELYKNIDLNHLKEFTFEAGREDTLTKEKLEILKEMKVDRVSLNPQTFNEKVLKELNRNFDKKHFDEMFEEIKKLGFVVNMDFIIGLPGESVEDILNTFETVKGYDIDNLTIHFLAIKNGSTLFVVNMDFIIGLPGESVEDILNTFETVKGYDIDNLTIHFLAIKNGSTLIKNKYRITEIENQRIEDKIREVVEEKNLKPYYLYRQKNSMNWGENLGYSIEGKESIFNIEMIEENQSTIGLGGGAISKKVEMIENSMNWGENLGYSIEGKESIFNIEMIEENQSTIGLGGGAISKKVEMIDETRFSIVRYINPKDPYMYICELKDRMKQKEELFKNL